MAQIVKNLSAMLEIQVQSLSGEDPWRRERLPTLILLLGEFHGHKQATVHGVAKSQT